MSDDVDRDASIYRFECTVPFDADYNGRPKVRLVPEAMRQDFPIASSFNKTGPSSSSSSSNTATNQTPLLALVTHPFYCLHKPRYGRCYEVRIGRPFEKRDNGWSSFQLLTSTAAAGLCHDFDMVDVWIKAWSQLRPILSNYLSTLKPSSAACVEQGTTFPRFGNLVSITLTCRKTPVTLYVYRYSDDQIAQDKGLQQSLTYAFEHGSVNLDVVAAISAAPDCIFLVSSRDMQSLPNGQYNVFQHEYNNNNSKRVDILPPSTMLVNAKHHLIVEMPSWMDTDDQSEPQSQSSDQDVGWDTIGGSSEARGLQIPFIPQLIFDDVEEEEETPKFASSIIEDKLRAFRDNDSDSCSFYYDEIWSIEQQNTILGYVTGDPATGQICISLCKKV